MNKKTLYDIIGIGIGPFNLGLAALSENIPELKTKFFDQSPSFNWHAGLLLPNTRLQVPFYADLVTLADPRSAFSFMSFLKANSRMFRFAIQENNFVSRHEYNQYCQWVISQLNNLLFGFRCEAIHFDKERNEYEVYVKETGGQVYLFHGRNIVLGLGTVPAIPIFAEHIDHSLLLHSSEYLFRKNELLKKKKVTIVGSGQSAAEVFYDLLQNRGDLQSLSWFTRAEYLFPMDSSQFAYEMSTPDYTEYFFNLKESKKHAVLVKQNRLYKGINAEFIREIYAQLYQNEINGTGLQVHIQTNCELNAINSIENNQLFLDFYHSNKEESFSYKTDAAILASGYKNIIPEFLHPVKELINWNKDGFYNVNRNYSVDNRNSIFVQNADLHTHGFNSADLGLGPYRNAMILNTILLREQFQMEKNIAFQEFGIE